MRNALFGAALVILMGIAIQPALSQPKIEVESPNFDFGVSYPNQILEHSFVLWNRGDQPLEIIKVSTTCGCTAAVLSSTTVLPSATSIVSVTLVTGAPRKKKESATLSTNDPATPRVVVGVETDVRNLWVFTPKNSFMFTEMSYETEQTMEIMMKNVDNDPFKVQAISVKEPELSVKAGVPTADGVPIVLTIKSGHEKKILNDQVMILTDHKKQPQTQIPVFGRIVGYVRFNRQRVFFGTMTTGESKTLEVTAQLSDSTGTEGLQFLDIKSDSNTVQGKVLGMRGDGQMRVELTYTAPSKPGYQTGTITLKTNQSKEPTVELPYSALVRPKS